MFIMTSLTTVKIQKQPRCPSTDRWIKKIWHIHMTDYHSAMKKNAICHVQQHRCTRRALC